jgi:heat shock protein HslJ
MANMAAHTLPAAGFPPCGMIFVPSVYRSSTHFRMKTRLLYPAFPIIVCALAFAACSSSRQQQRTPKNDVADMAALQNKRWVLTRLPDTSFKARAKDIYLQFQNSTNVVGFAGCNRVGGTFTAGAKTMSFSNMISTKMYCDNMPLENRMTRVLAETNAYLLSGETLELLRDDKPLAWFTAVYLK